MKKRILSLALALVMGLSLSACSNKDAASVDSSSSSAEIQATSAPESSLPETSSPITDTPHSGSVVRLGSLKGPTTIGLVKLLDDTKQDKTINSYYAR